MVNSSNNGEEVSKNVEKDHAVICGISGRFPDADNIDEFKQKLFSGVDMVTVDDRRFTPGLYGTPLRSGKLKTIDKFDAEFFSISPKQAHLTDPMLRMLLESTYEAIFDSGVNPAELRGSNTGVYIGTTTTASESEEFWLRDVDSINGLSGLGCCRAMFANRISYNFDFRGPSFPIDSTCASALLCLDLAVSGIRDGRCDNAIVAGVNLCLKPEATLKLLKLGVLSIDGSCKAFDVRANGYVRSEAIVGLFLRKQSVPNLRNYATILGTQTFNDGFKELGMLGPSGSEQIRLLQKVYTDAQVDIRKINYVETHGSGTQRGDFLELEAIKEILCKDRNSPLLVGSLKTNCGHSEPASGLLSIVKILISAQEKMLPANLHYEHPNPNIPALHDGSVQVVTKNTPFEGGIVGVSAFGIGGSNVHAILSINPKRKNDLNLTNSNYSTPLLVNFSGRTESSVENTLKKLSTNNKVDPEQIALIHNFTKLNVPNHPFRGFGIFPNDSEVEINVIEYGIEAAPEIYYIFSGMGSQWGGMGADLLKLSIFSNTIKKLSSTLQKYSKINLMSLIESKNNFENVANAFVGIVAIQIGVIDLLKSVNISFNGLIGHSVGEISCSYAEGSISAEEAILIAYYRGEALSEIEMFDGAMASIGLSWREAQKIIPSEIYLACHNAVDNVSISGPRKIIENFVTKLKSQNVFAKLIDSSGIAFHSPYIKKAEEKLRTKLDTLLTGPKLRSNKWISTSSLNDDEFCKYSSSAYHAHNLISPVYFYEALQKIPEGSTIIEIGPHGILQAILKRALVSSSNIFQMQSKYADDNCLHFLRTLGNIYASAGVDMDLSKLYPKISFPVSLETPMNFPLIEWDHRESWDVANFDPTKKNYIPPTHSATQNNLQIPLYTTSKNEQLSLATIEKMLNEALNALKIIKGETIPVNSNNSPLEKASLKKKEKVENEIVEKNGYKNGNSEAGILLNTVQNSLGIKNVSKYGKSMTLGELGMDSMLAVELRSILKLKLKQEFSMEQVLQLTVRKLKELDTQL